MAQDEVRCLEFFSGIGGLHYAFIAAGGSGEVVASFDMNEVANEVYLYNFKKAPVTRGIEFLSVADIQKRKSLDDQDERAKGLLHLIDLLPELDCPPKYLFLENVKNFEYSRSRERLVNCLDDLDYEIHECLLTPLQFGIPNDRLRYYLMARRKPSSAKIDSDKEKYIDTCQIFTTWPFTEEKEKNQLRMGDLWQTYQVPEKYITKTASFRFDIVRPSDVRCSCFTKGYGSRHVYRSGSLLQTRKLQFTDYDWENPASLLDLGLRFFSPLEIAKLHAFPVQCSDDSKTPADSNSAPRPFSPCTQPPLLEFPESISTKQRYRLLGNSLNVWVIAELMRCILFNASQE
ncbi:S-adenosyl-L-methionine-dependent methyltransferase [Basidiobolus meristosporus CBS 931.73]|uniref:tRNA (cytosine(38)-C(5))-methyltransferase n=1 Tax=Basidiobolus meristosporus CBS 931.73 TaxID=1314790 RepID=A0A1Y1ZC60_9FUNG|nr:S-adenosyl-L-methionine-dependent methyltransferase [Basidiobolus meristosporus CBS 931.73]|eukprot:ORY07872.1 S-adenosyl-L-methionine-dependent methyltransferase [Basidiobolus meristosporus CBS 931.73]